MPTLNDMLNQPPQHTGENVGGTPVVEADEIGYEPPRRGFNVDWIRSETGEGDLESYYNHPFMAGEPNKSKARILRGLTGMFGSLNWAIGDILIGALDILKTSKKGVVPNDRYFTGGSE